MINLALSLKHGPNLRLFRECLREVVGNMLDFIEGECPFDAVVHRMRVVKLFMSHLRHGEAVRVIMAWCPNGDWRNH